MGSSKWKTWVCFFCCIGLYYNPIQAQFWLDQTDSEILRHDRLDEKSDFGSQGSNADRDYAGAMNYQWFLKDSENARSDGAFLKLTMKRDHVISVADAKTSLYNIQGKRYVLLPSGAAFGISWSYGTSCSRTKLPDLECHKKGHTVCRQNGMSQMIDATVPREDLLAITSRMDLFPQSYSYMVDGIAKLLPNGSHVLELCQDGVCEPELTGHIIDFFPLGEVTTNAPTSFYLQTSNFVKTKAAGGYFYPICYIPVPGTNASAEVRMNYVNVEGQTSINKPTNTFQYTSQRKGNDDYVLLGTKDSPNSNLIDFNLRLSRLPKLKRSVLSFHHLCGTTALVEPQGECRLWLELTDANMADQKGQLIHTVDSGSFFKDGTFANVREWKHEKIPLTPIAEFEKYRLHLKGQHSKDEGILGLDNIHISTRERCTPRWTQHYGYKFEQDAINLRQGNYDDIENSEITQTMLTDKYAMLIKTDVSLDECTRLCFFGSACDMFEFDFDTRECVLTPHKALKPHPWHEITRKVDGDVALFILHCSTSSENVLDNHNWIEAQNNDGWDIDNGCRSWMIAKNGGRYRTRELIANGFFHWLRVLCDSGTQFKLQAQMSEDRLPLGIDMEYLRTTETGGFFRTWTRILSSSHENYKPRPGVEGKVMVKAGSSEGKEIIKEETYNFEDHFEYFDEAHLKVDNVQFQVQTTAMATNQTFELTQLEFVIDLPIRIGCFNVSSGTLDSTPSVTSDQTPSKCLTSCMKKNPLDPPRFAGLTNGEECHCFGRMPLEQLTSLPEEKCSKSCLGDSNQFCGGDATFSFFVATCPMGQKRFGDHCYQQLDIEQSIESNADSCTEKGMYLWWPDTEEEAVFVQKAFQGVDFRHVGYQFASHERGMLHADNSLGTGIMHVTMDYSQTERFTADESAFLMSSQKCAAINKRSVIYIMEPCQPTVGLCKSKLAIGGGNEFLGTNAQAEFYSPHLKTKPLDLVGNGPYHLGLIYDPYQAQRYLDIRFPHKTVLKSLLIETTKAQYIKSFKMKTSRLDFVNPGDLQYVTFYKDSQMVFRVFESTPLEMKPTISNTINLPTPIMTRHIRIEVLEAAQEINMRLDFIGMSAIKSYNYHPYMGQNYTLDHVVPSGLTSAGVLTTISYSLSKKEVICPGGEIVYRAKVENIGSSWARGFTLYQGSKTFYVQVKENNRRFLLTIGGTMGSGANDMDFEMPHRFYSNVGQAFEIKVNCERDRMEVFFKGDHVQTVYSTHSGNVIPTIDRIQAGSSSHASNVFIRFKDVQPIGLLWPFMAANSHDFPTSLSGLNVMSSFAIAESEGAYFQMYSTGDKDFGYNPIEFVHNCYNTITGNVRCFPGSLVRSTNLFGGDLDGKETKECPSGFNYLGKECVKLDTILRSETYWDAKKKCSEKDHMLYVPTDQDQNLAFRASLRHKSDTPTSHDIWIGVELASTSDIWMTVQGAELTAMTSDWAPGYPDMTFSEAKCAIASKVLDYQWMNVDCYQPRPYLCSPMAPACPKGYTWIPEAGRSCFKITEPLGQPPSYMSSDSIHMAHDMCRAEGTRLAVFQTVEERNAVTDWIKTQETHQIHNIKARYWLGTTQVDNNTFVHVNKFDPVTGEATSSGSTSMSLPCGQLQMSGGHLNQVRVNCFKEDPSFVSYGLCQSSQCFTTSGMVCAFPFRFKGRMYDQCITLGSKNGRPWCSTKTDRDHNHIDGMEADCNADCSVNNCPIGYQRLYGTQTCYKLSPSHPAKMASSFERAQDSCSLDGGRLLQPRSKSALQTMKNVEQFTVFQSTIISHVALGLMVHFESGLVKLYYSDGTMVPFKVQESMMEWDDSFPEEDATKACVAIMTVTGKLRNVPCQGYFNGTNEGHGKLGYICEARPIETLEADPIQVCHLPFIHNSTKHVGCAQSVHASTEMDTQGFPWCATEVNDRGEMVPGKWGKCRDERTIAYDNAVGHYCSVPFLMNKRYYDSCTRHATTPSALNRYYWCPIPSEASLNVSYSNVGVKGSCTDFLIPEENGCGDHYDDVGDMCMRVSTFPVNFDEAVEACNQDGADLIAIVDDVIRDAAIKLIEKKRLQFEHFRNMNYFWIAGRFSNQSQWHWTTHFQPFNKYTQWQANTPNYACKSTGCTHLNALLMQRDEDYSWRAADLGEQFGYVCLSKCSKGYTWYSKVQKCLKVVSYGAQNEKKRNLPQSLVQCGEDQGSLVALRSCQEMEMLNQQLADFFYPVDQVFQIGVFGFLKDPQANRHAPTDQLTDSRGYSMGLSTTFEKSRGLCDAKDSLLTDTLEESKTYGFGLKRAKGGLVTFHQEIMVQASQMSSYGYICHQEPIFGCPEGYAIFQDKCIKVFHQEQTKIDAEMTCRKNGAHLAKPTTHLEIQFIDELVRESEREMGITDLRDYWLGYNRQLDGDMDPLGLWNTTKHRCNCLGLPANNISGLFEDGDKCMLKSWSKLNVTEASNMCQSFNGMLATAATEDEYKQIISYLGSQNGQPMVVGLENPSGLSCTAPSSCGFLWMDENNTPANFSTFSGSKIPELKGDVESRCVGITDSGNFETVLCSDEMTSLCQLQCPRGVDTQFTDCLTLEHFGPDHVLVASKCTIQAGFVCSKDQDVKPTLLENMAEPVVLAPLNKALGSKDISKQGIVLEDHFVGYASLWAKSRLIGYPMLGGQSMSGLSYIEIKSGPEKLVSGTGLTVMFWLKIDQSPMDNFPLLDFRNPKNPRNGFMLGWSEGNLEVISKGEVVFKGLKTYQVTKAGEWNFVAFSFDEIKDEGTFYNGDKFGYNQNEMDHIHAHFNGNGSLKVGDALKLPGLIGKDKFNDSRTFHGSLSCLQIFNKGMSPSYVHFHKHCQNASSQVTDPCPEGFDFFDGMCYKIAISLASFIEAEIACSSNRDETGRYRSQLMWTRKREHYEFVQRVLVEKVGESEFWVGLDDLAGLGEFETSTGGEFVNRSDPIWAILNAGQGDCAKIPGPNGGFLTTDVCSKPLAYVCQQRPLYESPDNHCPDGFFSYKSSCLLPVKEELEFNQAQIHCGLHGSSLYASKSLADFQFIKQYARNHIRIDIWMGVERKSVIRSFDASEDNALEALETNDKSYADGTEFIDSTSFGFEFTSNGGIWQGPCLNLKASVQYAARDTKCTEKHAFFCQWNKPTCAPGYDLLGHVTDGRTCYKVTNTTILGTFDEDVCNAQYDESRWLGTPDTKLYTEEVIGLMRPKAATVWVGGALSFEGIWQDGIGEELTNLAQDMTDLRFSGQWIGPNSALINTTGCVSLNVNGVLQVHYNDSCQNNLKQSLCEQRVCYTSHGKQCIFPFNYWNITEEGNRNEITYNKCSTLGLHRPWCPTALNAEGAILEWGDCVPDCPSEEAEVACLEEPDFPEFVQDDESRYFRNYSTTYEQGSALVIKEMDYVSFECPDGFVFEGSTNITHYAVCHNWEYQYLFDKSAKCEPVVCPCPPWFANNSIEGTSDWHNEGGATKCPEDQSVLYGTNVTYTCPEGYVFETPQLIAFQEETSVLTLTCEKYADWSPGVQPNCIPVNCTNDPPQVNNDDKGWSNWDLAVRNKSYLHEITYSCPLKYWGFPSTGEYTKTISCLSSKVWNETHIEDCVQLPCKELPPPPPKGGWSWFEFDYSRYKCPNGFMFEDGSFPYWYANCSANRQWNPVEVLLCIPRKCAKDPPEPFMNMEQDWPKKNHDLGTKVEYQCGYNRITEKKRITKQYSQCIWDKDTDELYWFPKTIQHCSGKVSFITHQFSTIPFYSSFPLPFEI